MAFTPKPNPHVVQPKPLRQRFVRGLEPWAVEHLYTSDDRVLPGRYVKACRGTDYWSIHDYMEKAPDEAH